jgi:hypothetical protein
MEDKLMSKQEPSLVPGVPDKETIKTIKDRFSGYDKYIHAKVKRPAKYGITHTAEVQALINTTYGLNAVQAPTPRRKDTHRYTRKIACRLPDEIADKLQLYKKADGYVRDQDLLMKLITDYIDRKDFQAKLIKIWEEGNAL